MNVSLFMDKKKLIELFKNVGLNENHLKIYLYLLEFGPKKASKLAIYLRLNRTVTYDYLDHLVDLNLIILLPDVKVNTYCANPPESIKVLIENHMYKSKRSLFELEKILPELNLLQNKSEQLTQVSFYKGMVNCDLFFKKIFSDSSASIIKVIVGPLPESDNLYKLLYDSLRTYKPFVQEIHCIDGEISPATKKYIQTCLQINPNHQFRFKNFKDVSCEIVIKSDSFYMYSHENKPHVVDIQSAGLAKIQNQIFDNLWTDSQEINF